MTNQVYFKELNTLIDKYDTQFELRDYLLNYNIECIKDIREFFEQYEIHLNEIDYIPDNKTFNDFQNLKENTIINYADDNDYYHHNENILLTDNDMKFYLNLFIKEHKNSNFMTNLNKNVNDKNLFKSLLSKSKSKSV